MGAAKKIELFPDQEYIQRGLREGWITIHDLSMKALVVDPDHFQARVQSINMDHVHKLSMIRDTQDGAPLAPVVTFFDGESKFYLADGFHRHRENQNRAKPSIRAYVVGVENWRHEAMLFSTMCNQEMCLERSREDIRKAVEMMFEDRECWSWSDSRISTHCGVSPGTVSRHRYGFHVSRGVPLPDFVVGANGVKVPYKKDQSPPKVQFKKAKDEDGKVKPEYFVKVKGRKVDLGSNKNKAESEAKLIHFNNRAVPSRALEYLVDLQRYLQNGGHYARTISQLHTGSHGSYPYVRGLECRGVIIAFTKCHGHESLPWAVGCLMMMREIEETPGAKLVIVAENVGFSQESKDIVRRLGIEFMSPAQLLGLLDNIKAQEGEGDQNG